MLMAGLLALSSGALVTSCDDDDDYDTNQFSNGGVSLTAASLQVTRGAYMTFKGTNLNRVTSVEFPGGVSSTPEVVDEHTIKALVPEGAEPGTVKLIYNGGELETKAIAFTEPITFDDFTPKEVTAGDEITISGTYLTYIEFVQFATGENVEINNTNRTELKLTVPVDASTGKFNLGYYSVDGKDTVETLLESAEILKVAEPSELKVTTPTVKAGQDVEITGKLLRLVEYVSFNGTDTMINVAAVDPTKDRESIKVALPAKAKDGDVKLTLFSGLEFVAGQVKTVVPTAAIKDKKDTYGVGDIVTIEGENLDLIVSGYLNGADADTLATFEVKDGNILLNVTKAAKSGAITLNLANGESINVEGFVTTKPVATFPEGATPLDKLDVKSTLGARIATVVFGDLEAAANATETGFSVQVPLEAKNGCKITYIMDNGETGTFAESFTVNSYTFCAISSFKEEATSVGSLLEATVINGENLDYVTISGEKTEHLLVGTTLYVNVGIKTGKIPMVLVSTDGTEVPYTITVQATGLVETIFWTTPVDLSDSWRVWWQELIGIENIPGGATLRVHFTATGDDPQIKIYNPTNGCLYGNTADSPDGGNLKIDPSVGYFDLDPTKFPSVGWADIQANGKQIIINSFSYVIDYSAPTAIWTGEFSNASWAGNQDLAWGGYDWSLVDAGQTLYFDVKKVKAGSWGCISLRHGDNWGALVDAVNSEGKNQFDVGDDVDATTIEFTLTQAAIDDLVANGGLVITGDNLILTKVAIK